MKKTLLPLLVFLIFLLTGCVKILNDELKTKETKMVLNAAISTDSTFTVNVSRTFNIFEDESANNLPFIDSANVQLFENDQYLFNLDGIGYGYYHKSGFYPQLGKQYKVTVSYGPYKEIESVATIPQKVLIDGFDTSSVVISDGYGVETEYQGEITYNDPPDRVNYYQLSCKVFIFNDDTLENVYSQSIWPTDENDRFFETNAGGNLLWNDNLTNGKKVTFKFGFFYQYGGYKATRGRNQQKLKFVFYLNSVTKAYYTYLKSIGVYWETGGSENPFSEPVVIYSNVENGYGILGGFSADTTSVYFVSNNNGEGGKP